MIAYLAGTLAARGADAAVIDVGGVGMRVWMSAHSLASLPDVGQPARVHTYLQVREDALTLFGFATAQEQSLFEQLIGVTGVGPKVAMSALSSYPAEALANAIVSGDVAGVSRVPGIGKKTAQRIILELQGKLAAGPQVEGQTSLGSADAARGATEALLSMGFTSAEADLALKGAPEAADETALLQYALKRLGA